MHTFVLDVYEKVNNFSHYFANSGTQYEPKRSVNCEINC